MRNYNNTQKQKKSLEKGKEKLLGECDKIGVEIEELCSKLLKKENPEVACYKFQLILARPLFLLSQKVKQKTEALYEFMHLNPKNDDLRSSIIELNEMLDRYMEKLLNIIINKKKIDNKNKC